MEPLTSRHCRVFRALSKRVGLGWVGLNWVGFNWITNSGEMKRALLSEYFNLVTVFVVNDRDYTHPEHAYHLQYCLTPSEPSRNNLQLALRRQNFLLSNRFHFF